LRRLHAEASALDLSVLVEVHDSEELSRALAAGATIIGVNNRNLRTLAVDQTISERIALLLPRHVIAVTESGLRTHADLLRFRSLGYHAALIGERLMTASNPGRTLEDLTRAS